MKWDRIIKGGQGMKKMFVALLAAILLLVCAGCGNRPVIDGVWTFNKGMIQMPDGTVISGTVDSWRDFNESDMLQVKIDGQFYLTHSANVVLWTEK